MAVAYASSTVVNWGSVSSTGDTNITLPTGTQAGDLLVLFIDWYGHQSEDYSNPSGFTDLMGRDGAFTRPNVSYYYYRVSYKVATAGDITAGLVTMSSSGTYSSTAKATLVRVTGGAGSLLQVAGASDNTGTTTPSFANTITPNYANSLLLFRVFASPYSSGSLSSSDYAIATDNPVWTEITDTSIGDGDDGHSAVAYANRPQTTATGNSSCTLSAAKVAHGLLLVIPPIINAEATPSVAEISVSVQNPSITGDANLTATLNEATFSVANPTISFPTPDWTNQTKNTGTWTNQNKS